jgi:hypothetical protein
VLFKGFGHFWNVHITSPNSGDLRVLGFWHFGFGRDPRPDHAKFARAVNQDRNGPDLSKCREWLQPIGFFLRPRKLPQQQAAGPCNPFAVLQAYFVEALKLTPSGDPLGLLHAAVLELCIRISNRFILSIECDMQAQQCGFRTIDNQDTTLAFVL